MLVKREVILAKIESVYNTDPTPAAADDAILVEEPNWSHEGTRMIERNAIRASLAPLRQIYGGALKTVSFSCEVKGPGSAYSATVRPEIDVLLRACALGVTVVTTGGSETATYAPVSDNSTHESVTIYYYQDGTLHKLTGCRGNVSFSMEAGGRVMAEFTMTGHSVAPTDVSLADPTYDTTVPPAFLGASFSVHSFAAVIGALNFDLSNQLVMPPDANASDGFGEIQITGRDINGSFDPEHELVATEDFIGNFRSGTEGVLQTGTIGSTQYNRFAISFPKTYYREVAPGDRDGIRTLDISFGAVEDSGDDDISIAFS